MTTKGHLQLLTTYTKSTKKKKNQPRPYTFPRIIISLTLLSQSSHSIIFFFLKKTFYTATRKLLFTSFEQIALRLPIYSFLQCSFLSECKYMGVWYSHSYITHLALYMTVYNGNLWSQLAFCRLKRPLGSGEHTKTSPKLSLLL